MTPAHADRLKRASKTFRAVCDTRADAERAVAIIGAQYNHAAKFEFGGKVYVDFWND